MNTVYYLVGTPGANKGLVSTGGHGYTYDPEVIGKKKVNKNVPTQYGYYVESEHQNSSVNIINCLSGRAIGFPDNETSFLMHVEKLLRWHIDNAGSNILIITNLYDLSKKFEEDKKFNRADPELFTRVFALYQSIKSKVIFNHLLYPKGGSGVNAAHSQDRFARSLIQYTPDPIMVLDVLSEKDFNKPASDFNPIVDASRWFIPGSDEDKFCKQMGNGHRVYYFGRVEPKKSYYGKATPDTTYSALFTKHPVGILDKIYHHCVAIKENPLNHILAGDLTYIKSKEVTKAIDQLPPDFTGNKLVFPIRIATQDEPCLIEILNPPGLAYRIKHKIDELDTIYRFFLKRQDGWYGKTQFMDITRYFFVEDGKKLKISPEFTNNTLKFTIPVESPHCKNPVNITLSIRYDVPGRDAMNSIIKNKVSDVKVYLVLDFSNEGGVMYSTITTTPDFDYLHINAIANLKVYSLKELNAQ